MSLILVDDLRIRREKSTVHHRTPDVVHEASHERLFRIAAPVARGEVPAHRRRGLGVFPQHPACEVALGRGVESLECRSQQDGPHTGVAHAADAVLKGDDGTPPAEERGICQTEKLHRQTLILPNRLGELGQVPLCSISPLARDLLPRAGSRRDGAAPRRYGAEGPEVTHTPGGDPHGDDRLRRAPR